MVRVIIESQCWDILLDIKCSADIKQIFPSLSEKKKMPRGIIRPSVENSFLHLSVNDLFRNQTLVYSVRP